MLARFLALLLFVAGCLPAPTPTPSPGPVSGVRVLIVDEFDAPHTREQDAVLNSTAFAAALDRVEWRKWDRSSIAAEGLANESPEWRAAWEAIAPRLGRLPQIAVIANGRVTVSPLPESEAAALEFVKRLSQ